MTSLIASSLGANAKTLRQLAGIVQKTSSSDLPANAAALLEHCNDIQAFSTASAEDTTQFVESVCDALSLDNVSGLGFALQVTAHLARGLVPAQFALHWHTLTQRVLSLFKLDVFDSYSARRRAQVFSCTASLVTGAASCVCTSGEQKARIVIVAQTVLRHAFRTLLLPEQSDVLVLSVLSAVLAVLTAAPREMRATLPQLDMVLRDRLFIHSIPDVRTAAASLFAQASICIPEKVRTQEFVGRVSKLCADLEDILAIVEAFAYAEEKSLAPLHNTASLQLSSIELSALFSATCHSIVSALAVRLPGRTPFPLIRVIHIFCTAVRPRSIDPYSTGRDGCNLDAEGALVVASGIVTVALSALPVVLHAADRDFLLSHGATVCEALRVCMKSIVLQSRDDRSCISTMPLRTRVYHAIADAIPILGSIVIDETIVLAERMLQTDVSFHLRYVNAHAKATGPARSGEVPSDAPPRGRKRRRKDRVFNGRGAHDEPATVPDKLDPLFSRSSLRAIRGSLDAGLYAIKAMFECRGLLTEKTCDHLRTIEGLILKCIDAGVTHDAIIAAAGAAAAGGGSNRMNAFASPLFHPHVQLITDMCVRNSTPAETRKLAFIQRTICEPIIHPRGPPVRQPPTLNRMGTASSDSARKFDRCRRPSQDSGSLNRNDTVRRTDREVAVENGLQNIDPPQPSLDIRENSLKELKYRSNGVPVVKRSQSGSRHSLQPSELYSPNKGGLPRNYVSNQNGPIPIFHTQETDKEPHEQAEVAQKLSAGKDIQSNQLGIVQENCIVEGSKYMSPSNVQDEKSLHKREEDGPEVKRPKTVHQTQKRYDAPHVGWGQNNDKNEEETSYEETAQPSKGGGNRPSTAPKDLLGQQSLEKNGSRNMKRATYKDWGSNEDIEMETGFLKENESQDRDDKVVNISNEGRNQKRDNTIKTVPLKEVEKQDSVDGVDSDKPMNALRNSADEKNESRMDGTIIDDSLAQDSRVPTIAISIGKDGTESDVAVGETSKYRTNNDSDNEILQISEGTDEAVRKDDIAEKLNKDVEDNSTETEDLLCDEANNDLNVQSIGVINEQSHEMSGADVQENECGEGTSVRENVIIVDSINQAHPSAVTGCDRNASDEDKYNEEVFITERVCVVEERPVRREGSKSVDGGTSENVAGEVDEIGERGKRVINETTGEIVVYIAKASENGAEKGIQESGDELNPRTEDEDVVINSANENEKAESFRGNDSEEVNGFIATDKYDGPNETAGDGTVNESFKEDVIEEDESEANEINEVDNGENSTLQTNGKTGVDENGETTKNEVMNEPRNVVVKRTVIEVHNDLENDIIDGTEAQQNAESESRDVEAGVSSSIGSDEEKELIGSLCFDDAEEDK